MHSVWRAVNWMLLGVYLVTVWIHVHTVSQEGIDLIYYLHHWPREVQRNNSRAANRKPTGWTEMGDSDRKFIVPDSEEGSKLHGQVPRGVRHKESSV